MRSKVHVIAIVATMSLFSSVRATDSKESLRARAVNHWYRLCEHLDAVYCGAYHIEYTSIDEKGNRAAYSGDFTFDFRSDQLRFCQNAGTDHALYWAQNKMHEISFSPSKRGPQNVSLRHLGADEIRKYRSPMEDFRLLPDLTLGNMLLRSDYESQLQRLESGDDGHGVSTVMDAKFVDGMIEVTVEKTPRARTLDKMLDDLPVELHSQILEWKAKGVLIPARRGRYVYTFDDANPGILLQKEGYGADFGKPFELQQSHRVEWTEVDGYWVPCFLKGEFSGDQLEIRLDWTSVNRNVDDSMFTVDGFPEFAGKGLVDLRLPQQSRFLGIIGENRIQATIHADNWKTALVFFGLSLLLLLLSASAYALRRRRRTAPHSRA